VKPDSLAIGDTFQYIITAQYQSARYTATFPDSSAFEGDIEFKSVQRFRGVQSRDSVVYTLQFFALNDTIIAPKVVLFSGSEGNLRVNTLPVSLYFKSLLDETATELHDLKPLFTFTQSWFWVILLFVAIALTALLLYRYRNKFRKNTLATEMPFKEVTPYVNPISKLQQDLLELQQLSSYANDNFRDYYTRLSNAFRTYFENVYFIPALESTSREVLRDLKRKGIDDQIVTLLQSLLKESDMIKFAKYAANSDQAVASYQVAEQLLRALRKADIERIEQLRISYEIRNGLRDPQNPSSTIRVINPLITPKQTNL
jgi:hypothetical protein